MAVLQMNRPVTHYMVAAFAGTNRGFRQYLATLTSPEADLRQSDKLLRFPTVQRCPVCGSILEHAESWVGGKGYVSSLACPNRKSLDLNRWCGYARPVADKWEGELDGSVGVAVGGIR